MLMEDYNEILIENITEDINQPPPGLFLYIPQPGGGYPGLLVYLAIPQDSEV